MPDDAMNMRRRVQVPTEEKDKKKKKRKLSPALEMRKRPEPKPLESDEAKLIYNFFSILAGGHGGVGARTPRELKTKPKNNKNNTDGKK